MKLLTVDTHRRITATPSQGYWLASSDGGRRGGESYMAAGLGNGCDNGSSADEKRLGQIHDGELAIRVTIDACIMTE